MPIRAVCSDCGKKYLVASAMAGKRAKCKICGNVFRIGAAQTPKVKIPTTVPAAPQAPKPPNPVVPISHDLGIAGAFTRPPPAALSPGAARLERWMEIFSWFQLRWWMLGLGLCYAIAIGWGAHRWPGILRISILAFPAAASVFLILGIIHTAARALISPADVKIPWGDLRLIVTQFVLVVFLRMRWVAYRRAVLRYDQYRKFYRRMLVLIFKVILLASMSGMLLAAKSASKSMPSLDKIQRTIQSIVDDSHKHRHDSGGEQSGP